MGYETALENAWSFFKDREKTSITFLKDEYDIDFLKKSIMSLSCNIEAKIYYKILILHYLANENKVEDIASDKWISFKDLPEGQFYYSAFRKRAIEPIIRKYEEHDKNIIIEVFPKVKVNVITWAKDEDFSAECNMLFNSSIEDILSTEDVAVLGGIAAWQC